MSTPNQELSTPASSQNPMGICGTCRHFIDDPRELGDELAFIARQRPLLVTGERLVTRTREVHAADGTRTTVEVAVDPAAPAQRVAYTIRDLAHALYERWGVGPADLGLCEKGVARLVHRAAGSGGVGACPKWVEQPTTRAPRARDWREEREKLLAGQKAGGGLRLAAILPKRNEPCFCGSGVKFKKCHGKGLD